MLSDISESQFSQHIIHSVRIQISRFEWPYMKACACCKWSQISMKLSLFSSTHWRRIHIPTGLAVQYWNVNKWYKGTKKVVWEGHVTKQVMWQISVTIVSHNLWLSSSAQKGAQYCKQDSSLILCWYGWWNVHFLWQISLLGQIQLHQHPEFLNQGTTV